MQKVSFDEAVMIIKSTAPNGFFFKLSDFKELDSLSRPNRSVFTNANLYLSYNEKIHKDNFKSLNWNDKLVLEIDIVRKIITALDAALNTAMVESLEGLLFEDPLYHFIVNDAIISLALNQSIYLGKSIKSFKTFIGSNFTEHLGYHLLAFCLEQALQYRATFNPKLTLAAPKFEVDAFNVIESGSGQESYIDICNHVRNHSADIRMVRNLRVTKKSMSESKYNQALEHSLIKTEEEKIAHTQRKVQQKIRREERRSYKIYLEQSIQEATQRDRQKKKRFIVLMRKLKNVSTPNLMNESKKFNLNLTESEKQSIIKERLRISLCPRPEKKVYASFMEANNAIKRKHKSDSTIESYLCDCGKKHIGHPQGKKKQAIII